MPIKDDTKRREYFREYMRARRAVQKEPAPKQATTPPVDEAAKAKAQADERIVVLTMKLHEAEKRISALQARVKRAEQAAKDATAANADAELLRKYDEAKKHLAKARARLREVANSPLRKVFILRANRRKILACLHPDTVQDPARKKRYEDAFKIFSDLPYTEIEDD